MVYNPGHNTCVSSREQEFQDLEAVTEKKLLSIPDLTTRQSDSTIISTTLREGTDIIHITLLVVHSFLLGRRLRQHSSSVFLVFSFSSVNISPPSLNSGPTVSFPFISKISRKALFVILASLGLFSISFPNIVFTMGFSSVYNVSDQPLVPCPICSLIFNSFTLCSYTGF